MTPTAPPSNRTFDKAAFFRSLDYHPHPGQVPIHASTASRRIVACGVRWGKTLSAAMEALAAMMVPAERSVGWVVAPTYDLSDRVFREIELLAMKHLRHRVVAIKENERRLLLTNLAGGVSEVRGKSADNPVSLLGAGLDWLIVDEAARLKPTIWESHLSQRLLDRRGWALLISTPFGKGWYWDLFMRGQRGDADFASWNAPSWTNPHLDRALIEAERERLPERTFREQYEAAFVEGTGCVFRRVRDCAVGDWAEPVKDASYAAGLDLAKSTDFSVLCILDDDKRLVFSDRFNRLDWSVQLPRIAAATERYGHAPTNTDTTGAGEPVYEALLHAGCNAVAYPFTARSKAALIDNLAMMIEKREVQLPSPHLWPVGIDELEAYSFSITDSGNVRTSAPSGMHDDCVMALALAAWQAREGQGVCYTHPMI